MNSKKKSKANNNKSQRNRKNKNRQEFSTTAPIAVSNDIQQRIRFGTGKEPGSLRIQATIPIYQVSSGSTQTFLPYAGGLVSTADPTTSIPPATSVQMGCGQGVRTNDMLSYPYLSPALALLSDAFVRYRMQKLVFIYEPQAPSTINDRVVFAYTEDPRHPLMYTKSTLFGDQLSTGKLLALGDSIAFAPWESWTMDVSRSAKQDLLYVAMVAKAPDGTNNMLATERFFSFGSIGCVTTNLTGSGFVIYGILYMSVVFDLVEFCPIVQSAVVPLNEIRSNIDCDDKTCPRCTRCCKHESEEENEVKNRTSCLVKSNRK
jgi:hypothetical protein